MVLLAPRSVSVVLGLLLSVFFLASSPVRAADIAEARAKVKSKDYEAAVEILEKIIQDQPKNPEAWKLLGMSYHAMKMLDDALNAHLRATKFPQTRPGAFYNVACVHALQGNKKKAFQYLRKAGTTGAIDLARMENDPDLAHLKDDPQFRDLCPSPEMFADPFVEDVEIIHEWDGEAPLSQFGWIARNIGDVDGDGIFDVTTSAPSLANGGPGAGCVYVYSSKSGKLLWKVKGKPGESLGSGIEAAGDTNGDGIPDVIAGAPSASKAYVYSGKDGAVLLSLAGKPGDSFGRKVSDVGDVNGDGCDDLLIGAPTESTVAKNAGRLYVYSGKDGKLLFDLAGERAGDNFGSSAGGASTKKETLIVVGAPNAGPKKSGRTYVYSGAGELKFVIEADATGAQLGAMFVSVIGDIDADGTKDVYASDFSNTAKGNSTGRIFIHSGKDGKQLLTLTGESAGDGFGIGPADAGDANSDGHDDIIVGAWQHNSAARSGGKCYLYSGKDGKLLREFTCKVPGDTFGFDATGMGDVNGDGLIDYLLTSAWSGVKGSRSGRMFIVAGTK